MNTDTAETTCIIAYYRVSTQKQSDSGLGLDAQKAAVKRYTDAHGLTISQSFTEVETGTSKKERPQIKAAITAAKKSGCRLVIAKLDRLARSVSFISAIMDSKVDFIACDMPDANPLTIHIMAAMAEHEAKMISQRTKAALDAKRARDGEWRVSNLDNSARSKSATTRSGRADEFASTLGNYINLMRNDGLSFGKIAKTLNSEGKTTIKGKQFTATAVQRIHNRYSLYGVLD